MRLLIIHIVGDDLRVAALQYILLLFTKCDTMT